MALLWPWQQHPTLSRPHLQVSHSGELPFMRTSWQNGRHLQQVDTYSPCMSVWLLMHGPCTRCNTAVSARIIWLS
jgi:hypothetical protein